MRWNKIRLVKVYLSYNQFTITFQTIFSKGIYFIKQQNSKPTFRIFILIYIYRLNDWSVDQLLFVSQIISSEMWGTLESSYINNKIIMIIMPNYNRFIVYNTVSWCPLSEFWHRNIEWSPMMIFYHYTVWIFVLICYFTVTYQKF